MLEHQGLEGELSQLIVKVANLSHLDPSKIDPSTPLLREGLGLDSIDILELVVHIEKRYGLKLRNDDEGRNALASVSSLADYTRRHLNGASARP